MLFKGTPRHPEIKKEFQRYGGPLQRLDLFDRHH